MNIRAMQAPGQPSMYRHWLYPYESNRFDSTFFSVYLFGE